MVKSKQSEWRTKELESFFIELSAKSETNIEDLFQTITSSLLD